MSSYQHGSFITGAPSEEAQVLSDYMRQVLEECSMIDPQQLSICAGHYCWLLRCDIMCCNYDGTDQPSYICRSVNRV